MAFPGFLYCSTGVITYQRPNHDDHQIMHAGEGPRPASSPVVAERSYTGYTQDFVLISCYFSLVSILYFAIDKRYYRVIADIIPFLYFVQMSVGIHRGLGFSFSFHHLPSPSFTFSILSFSFYKKLI